MANRALNQRVSTYSAFDVIITIGGATVTGVADDSFISIEPKGDGITSRTGCDGEVVRAIDPNRQYRVSLVLLQTSEWNSILQQHFNRDRTFGDGTFEMQVKDSGGKTLLYAKTAWVLNTPAVVRGKDATNYEWAIETCAVPNSGIAL